MGEKIDIAKDLFDTVDQECKDSFEAFLLTIEAARTVEPHPENCPCGDKGCARLRAFRRYIRAYMRYKKREGQLERMEERVKERAKLDEYDDAFITSLGKDYEVIKNEVADAKGIKRYP
jgi:hypothetical protein